MGVGEDVAAVGQAAPHQTSLLRSRPGCSGDAHGITQGLGACPPSPMGHPITQRGLSWCFGIWFCFLLFTPSSLVFIVKLQTFPSTSLHATTFPTLPSSETPEGSRKREVCDKQMGNRENSQTKRGMRRRREQGADSWPLGREGEAGGLLR